MDVVSIALAGLAMLAGGVLKGAVGAGAPVVAVPILVLLFDVPFAVSLFVLPNLLSNSWQGFQYRRHLGAPRFALIYGLAGAIGAGVGSVMLATLPADNLMLVVAIAVIGYVVFRLLRPGWKVASGLANRLVFPVGVLGGILQGAGGISAPISVTFLNAMKLERPVFIATISIFFFAMSIVQIPTLIALGILTPNQLGLSLLAFLPLFGGMRVGSWLARHIKAETFDKIVLVLLVVIAARLIWSALA
ncbi:MAG: putative membrane protein YfcA [Dinoroseobacter sp.]|jgi:uncharacterized membrane protein YfcA